MEPSVTTGESMQTAASRDTLDRIRKVFIASLALNLEEKDLREEMKLDELAGLDSLAVLEFVSALEKEFGISIEPQFLELDFVTDLPRLASYIEKRGAHHPGSKP